MGPRQDSPAVSPTELIPSNTDQVPKILYESNDPNVPTQSPTPTPEADDNGRNRFSRRNAIDAVCHPEVAETASQAISQSAHLISTKRLCGWCQGITIEALCSEKGYAYFPSPWDMIRCNNRCDFCEYMFRSWAVGFIQEWIEYRRETGDQRSLTLHLVTRDRGCPCSEVLPRLEGEDFTFSRSYSFRVRAAKDDPAVTKYGVMAEGDPSPGSPYTLDLARMWMAHCQRTHTCHQRLPFTEEQHPGLGLPPRLLDLGHFPEDVRLVMATSLSSISVDYVALSHCWGPEGLPDSSKLTSSNLAARLTRIPLTSLCLNFQHAIATTRLLGLRYLWIDALCIQQDSLRDWQSESARMATIYSRAAVTIAAAIGPDANSGCFKPVVRPASLEDGFVAGVCIFAVANPIVIANILSTKEISTLHFYARTWPQNLDTFFHGGPLASRAWTLQETIMSPRILHFTPGGLFWQCRAEYRSEEGYHYIQSPLATDQLTTSAIGRLFVEGRDDADDRSPVRMFSFYLWYSRIVPDYTRRKLTFQTDKLAAISSVARAMAWQTRWEYLAGLWSRRLAWGLTWCRKERREYRSATEQPVLERKPSWSWVTCDFEVHWPRLAEDEEKVKPGWDSTVHGSS
ncbi:heterokaryon incompatibility protein-domain-containing protein, partial [Lasiosphaeria ovina]